MALNVQDTYANWQAVQGNVDWWSPTLSTIFSAETHKTMTLLPAIKIVQFYVNNPTQDSRTRVAWHTLPLLRQPLTRGEPLLGNCSC